MKMSEKIARVAGWDAGNRHAKAAGRVVWDESDYAAACEEFERLWPVGEVGS